MRTGQMRPVRMSYPLPCFSREGPDAILCPASHENANGANVLSSALLLVTPMAELVRHTSRAKIRCECPRPSSTDGLRRRRTAFGVDGRWTAFGVDGQGTDGLCRGRTRDEGRPLPWTDEGRGTAFAVDGRGTRDGLCRGRTRDEGRGTRGGLCCGRTTRMSYPLPYSCSCLVARSALDESARIGCCSAERGRAADDGRRLLMDRLSMDRLSVNGANVLSSAKLLFLLDRAIGSQWIGSRWIGSQWTGS